MMMIICLIGTILKCTARLVPFGCLLGACHDIMLLKREKQRLQTQYGSVIRLKKDMCNSHKHTNKQPQQRESNGADSRVIDEHSAHTEQGAHCRKIRLVSNKTPRALRYQTLVFLPLATHFMMCMILTFKCMSVLRGIRIRELG